MKVTLIMLGLSALTAMAAPSPERRQNDIPECVDGVDGPDDGFDTQADCVADCILRENADGDNKYGSCAGSCLNVGHPAPIFQCFGDR